MKNKENSVKATNLIPSTDTQLNEAKHTSDQQEYKSLQWLDELNILAYRHSHLHILPDLVHMPINELHGVYLWLKSYNR